MSDPKANEILRRLREVATPGKTKVVVIDGVIQYACAINRKEIRGADDIVFEGSDEKSKVAGLLPNLGRAGARNYYLDLVCGLPLLIPFYFLTKSRMLAMHNTQERTLGGYIQMMEAGGWKIRKIYSLNGRRISHVLAEAA